MPAPYDYMSQIQRPDLAKSITSGLMLGQAYGEAVQAQQLREKEAAFKKDFATLFQNPTWETTTALITKYPEYVDKIQAAKKMYGEEKIKGEFDYATKVFRAAQYGNIDIAKKLTQEQIDAARNRGEDVSEYETILKGFDTNPKATTALIGSLAAGLDPEKWKAFADADLARAKIASEIQMNKRKSLAPSVLEAIDYESLTPQQQLTFQGLALLKKPPAAVTNVNVTNLEKTGQQELGKLLPDLYSQANAAASQAAELPRYRKALENAITGPLADQRLTIARIGNVLGFTGDSAINATRELIQGNAEMALSARKLLAGQGQITENEQKLLIQAKAGDISFTKGELETLFNVFERASKAQYDKSTNLLKSAASRSETAQMFLDNVSPFVVEEAPPTETATQIVVQLPNGKSKAFPNQKAADDFKKAAGIP